MTVNAQVTTPRSRKKKITSTPELNQVIEITDDGEDVILPEDLNNNDKED